MLRARDAATKAGLVRISLTPGFAYSDVDRAGFSVLAVVDVDSQKSAASVVGEVLADVDRHASEFEVTRDDVRAGVERALAADHPPVILVDVGDNVGAGSAGDGTALLAELLRQGARDAIVTLADADVARAAAQLGCGSWIDTHVGGKTDRMHGVPVRIKGRVRRLSDGWYRTLGTWMTGQEFEMGITAVIEVEGNFLLVTERPTPPFHLEQLTHLGLDPSAARVVTAKGAIAWRAALGAVAQEVVEVATPGLCPIDVSSLQRQSKPVRVEP
jgi:microcystin degradation protein MlrC